MKEAIESVAEIVTWCISTLYPLSVACNQQLLMTGTGKILTDFSLPVSIKKRNRVGKGAIGPHVCYPQFIISSCSRECGIYAVLGILSLSTTEASLCRREPGALSIFRLLLFLLGYPAETSAKERGI